MERAIEQPNVDKNIVLAMRHLAGRGANVRELVECVQLKLILKPDAILSVLWYFMKAFDLPLDKVLPIREWLGTRNDASIDALILPAIEQTRSKWGI